MEGGRGFNGAMCGDWWVVLVEWWVIGGWACALWLGAVPFIATASSATAPCPASLPLVL